MTDKKLDTRILRTYAEIDLNAAEYNFTELSLIAKKPVIAVVKADAYGHGAGVLAPLYERLGAAAFATATLDEALELRAVGITRPILVLGFVHPHLATLAADADITLAVYSYALAKQISDALSAEGKSLKIHLKFDTGMGRIGFIPSEIGENSLRDALAAARLPGLLADGAFTHFAVADGGDDPDARCYTEEQARKFGSAKNYLLENGVCLRMCHVSNSAATLDRGELSLDAVRLGISLYGMAPSGDILNPFRPKPVMTLRTLVSHVKTIEAGDTVGYGRAFKAGKRMRVATCPVGYADGLVRASSRGGALLTVKGHAAPILGRVCMDQLMLDVTDLDVHPFDSVTVFGKGAKESADTLAEKIGTIGYEVTSLITGRVPRVYTRDGEILDTPSL